MQVPERISSGETVAPRLTAEEARALTEEAREQAAALWRTLLRLYEGGAHLALGYASWAAYFNAEFREQRKPGQRPDPKHPYRLLRAARVEAEVSVHVDTAGMKEAHARVLAPLTSPVREEIVRRVAQEAGGFGAVTAARVQQIRDEVIGVRRLVGGRLVWDERALPAAASAVLQGGALAGAFANLDGLRKLPPEDAARVRAVIASALVDMNRARRAAQQAVVMLEDAARALDARADLPGPPFPAGSWEDFDYLAGVPETRQMTVQGVLARIRDEDDEAARTPSRGAVGRRSSVSVRLSAEGPVGR